MFLYFSVSLLLIAAGVGIWSLRVLVGLHRELVQAQTAAGQAAAEAAQLREALQKQAVSVSRQSQRTRQDLEFIEDMAAVFSDVDHELRECFRYVFARLGNGEQIIKAGRKGPTSYKPQNTTNRPPRPSHNVKLWTS